MSTNFSSEEAPKVIDLILDRYNNLAKYNGNMMYKVVDGASKEGALDVVRAFLESDEMGFKDALARYIRKGMYNRDLILYVYSVEWIVV